METYIILSEKKWHKDLYKNLLEKSKYNKWVLIDSKEKFQIKNLKKIKPNKIFIPHWSYIIPKSIFENYECIVFHMTDLPFGRGGSPLQNLIIRGFNETKISALRVKKGVDTGDIYLKDSLTLSGSAQDIFIRSNYIIEKMIKKIIKDKIKPIKQKGKVTTFIRRKPSQSNLSLSDNLDQIYNHIRMLDAEGYPRAFLDFNNFRLEFSSVSKTNNKYLKANVRIFKK